jgi:ABC-type glycerol-3-phosphate transport system substrate-binding protein
MSRKRITRRRFIAGSAASAAAISAPYVSTAYAAGKLSLGMWDHWIPGGNKVFDEVAQEWAAKEKVELTIDYLSTQGNKLLLTIAAEAQARAGHDVMDFSAWEPAQYTRQLEPVGDVMKEVLATNGPISGAMEYIGTASGVWNVVPSTRGTLILPPCSRIDYMKEFAGIDVQAMYPAGKDPTPTADNWTWDALLVAAEKCHKAGHSFGLPLGATSDALDWVGTLFSAFGAALVDAKGNTTVKSDEVRQVLDYAKRLFAFLPPDVASWDNASNNKWLISGKGALIFNPPSTWVVAKRDAPQVAEKLWTHAMPKGPKGRYAPMLARYQGIWNFSKNKSAAKSLMVHINKPDSIRKLVAGAAGYDIPPYQKLIDYKVWDAQGPPPGTLSHYPNRADQINAMPCSPAPPPMASQLYTNAIMPKMIVRMGRGETIDKTLAWAESEIEGFRRN